MFHIFYTNFTLNFRLFSIHILIGLTICTPFIANAKDDKPKSTYSIQNKILAEPIKNLFRHSKHSTSFKKLGISCTDCHTFSVKSKNQGPLHSNVSAGYLQPPKGICHQCHLGKIALPRPNQCLMCHVNTQAIQPDNHQLDWKTRHGRMAQLDRQSCSECHTPSTCSRCHSKVDVMNPSVHEPNFRLTHSIRARAQPQSCIQCHKAAAFCKDCHTGVK